MDQVAGRRTGALGSGESRAWSFFSAQDFLHAAILVSR